MKKNHTEKCLAALFTLPTFPTLAADVSSFPFAVQFPSSLLRATTEREGNVSRKTKYHGGGLKRAKSEKDFSDDSSSLTCDLCDTSRMHEEAKLSLSVNPSLLKRHEIGYKNVLPNPVIWLRWFMTSLAPSSSELIDTFYDLFHSPRKHSMSHDKTYTYIGRPCSSLAPGSLPFWLLPNSWFR